MPIEEIDVPGSDGWWLNRLARRLLDKARQDRLNLLDDWYKGCPPLPIVGDNVARAYNAFQEHARSNFAELITEAPRDRMVPVGIRTGVDGDETGDLEAWNMWRGAGLPVESAEVHRMMLAMGDAFVITGPPEDGSSVPVITAEDPRQVVTEHDPRHQRRVLSALKMFRDDVSGRDLAYLYFPGRVRVAFRAFRAGTSVASQPKLSFSPRSWEWDEELSGALPDGLMPVTRFRNRRGVGEFEPHLPLLRRINHQILQRMTIATLQAFRQRGIKGLPEKDPATGKVIDYNDVFSADPGALWQLPEGVEMWESGQVDLTPILSAVRADVEHLAAVTRRPMHMLMPAGENQSAEGAAKSTEGLVYLVEDRRLRTDVCWCTVVSNGFRYLEDEDRSDPTQLSIIWAPAERFSLTQKADAAVKAKAADMPWRWRATHIWQIPPDEVNRLAGDRASDAILESLRVPAAAATADPAGQPVTDGNA